jgi:hypothetical protein
MIVSVSVTKQHVAPHGNFSQQSQSNAYKLTEHLLVLVECVRQHNEVAIIPGVISPLSLWDFSSGQTWSLIG